MINVRWQHHKTNDIKRRKKRQKLLDKIVNGKINGETTCEKMMFTIWWTGVQDDRKGKIEILNGPVGKTVEWRKCETDIVKSRRNVKRNMVKFHSSMIDTRICWLLEFQILAESLCNWSSFHNFLEVLICRKSTGGSWIHWFPVASFLANLSSSTRRSDLPFQRECPENVFPLVHTSKRMLALVPNAVWRYSRYNSTTHLHQSETSV